jgi:hypothetical protein
VLEHCHDALVGGTFWYCQDHGTTEAIILVVSFEAICWRLRSHMWHMLSSKNA